MQSQKSSAHDGISVALLVIGLILFSAGVLIALVSDSLNELNLACGLVLLGLFVSIAGGLSRQRHERAMRNYAAKDTLAH